MWVLWWTKQHWGRFFSEFLGFPLSISFHPSSACSCITWRMNKRPNGGCSSEISSHPTDINKGDTWMMNCKGFGRKWVWPNFMVLSRHSPGGTEEGHETYHNSQSLGWGLSLGVSKYEAGVLTTGPWHLVTYLVRFYRISTYTEHMLIFFFV
jgi:hypothetical protein